MISTPERDAPALNHLPFSVSEAYDKTLTTPVHVMFWNLVRYPHHFGHKTGFAALQDTLSADLSEADDVRIFMGEGPQNDQERELKHVIELRGALYSLTARYYGYLPSDLQQLAFDNAIDPSFDINNKIRVKGGEEPFSEQARERTADFGKEYHYESGRTALLNTVYSLGSHEPSFPPDEPELKDAVSSVHEKMNHLVAFYKQQGILQPSDKDYFAAHDQQYQLRAGVINGLTDMFDPARDPRAFA